MCIIVGMPVELCGWERLTELANVTGYDGTTITRRMRRRATRMLDFCVWICLLGFWVLCSGFFVCRLSLWVEL